MRKILEMVSIAALAYLAWITAAVMLGPHALPARIPVHFDAAGQPDGWGSPKALLGMPIFGAFLYGLMTVVARFPAAFNFPVRVTPANRPRLEALALEMIAWLKAEVLCLFAWVQQTAVASARSSQAHLSPWFMPVTLGAVFATIGWYMAAMRRAAKMMGQRAG